MKKLICLLLLVVVCIVLIGCEFSGVQDTTTSTTPKRIEPSERDPILDELELDYTDNFDEYDVEFIKTMRYTRWPGTSGYDKETDFQDAMRVLSAENNTLYKINVEILDVLYFIAVYENFDCEGYYYLEIGGAVERVKWCKYMDYNNIPSEIDEWRLIGSYAVYNCEVEKDILNDITYNHTCKYYVPLTDGYYAENNQSTYWLYETAVWLDLCKLFGREIPLTVLHTAKYDYFYTNLDNCIPGKDIYRYSVDENGVEYLDGASIQSIVDEYWKK